MKKDNNKVIYWLLTGCILIFIMVVVGGITRLTHSGLSISNYKLISGVNAVPLKEYRIDPVIAQEFGELDLSQYIQEDRTTVFIVPSYSNETKASKIKISE